MLLEDKGEENKHHQVLNKGRIKTLYMDLNLIYQNNIVIIPMDTIG